jgi:hypothetical protein
MMLHSTENEEVNSNLTKVTVRIIDFSRKLIEGLALDPSVVRKSRPGGLTSQADQIF